jgi:hypothetical protein
MGIDALIIAGYCRESEGTHLRTFYALIAFIAIWMFWFTAMWPSPNPADARS